MAPTRRSRRALRRLLWVPAVTLTLLVAGWVSLLLTSDPLTPSERQAVDVSIDLLDRQGFSKEAFLLRNVVSYRATDNWWNRYTGHQQAYAATNFPFEVLTLYRPFFAVAQDDVERAAILLHESHHLAGAGEDAALRAVWLEKQQLGWTADKYSRTRVFKNTKEWTTASAPGLFRCGDDRQSDCLE